MKQSKVGLRGKRDYMKTEMEKQIVRGWESINGAELDEWRETGIDPTAISTEHVKPTLFQSLSSSGVMVVLAHSLKPLEV